MATLTIRHFGDPACPWDFSAEPTRYRLAWLYGRELAWTNVMVGLSERPEDYLERGYTTEGHAGGLADIQARYGMPIDTGERPRMLAAVPACRAVVAARLHEPDREEALLRRLRVLTMAGEMTDEPAVLARAAREVGIAPLDLRRWMSDPDVERALRDDMAEARMPARPGLALDHKLGDADPRGRGDGRRYTCPTYEITRADGAQFVLPGFHPTPAYEAAIANLAPELERRPEPESVTEVLEWAGEPLATAEVAAVCGLDQRDARTELARVASLEPVGPDGFWTPAAGEQRLAA
jgi:predicted DsbA family dithiol-disulfide isomerase